MSDGEEEILYESISRHLKNQPGFACAYKYKLMPSGRSYGAVDSSVKIAGNEIKLNYYSLALDVLVFNTGGIPVSGDIINYDNNLYQKYTKKALEKKTQEAFVKFMDLEGDNITYDECYYLTARGQVEIKQQTADEIAKELAEKNIREDEKKCNEFGFQKGTENFSLCLMKQSELRTLEKITEENKSSNSTTVINEAPKKSRGGSTFCQKMPGAYTTTYHCW